MTNGVSFAQENESKFDIGFHFGVNASFFNDRIGEFGDNDNIDYDNFVRFSSVFGLKAKFKLSNIISIKPEINYHLRGGSYRRENNSVISFGSSGSEDVYYNKNYRLYYAESPLLVSFNLAKLFNKEVRAHKVQVHFNSGIAPAVNTHSSLRYNSFRTVSNGTPLADVDEEYQIEEFSHAEKFIWSYIAEISFDFQNGQQQNMFVNVRLSQTISDVFQIQELNGYNMQTKMTTFVLGFGLMLYSE